MSDPNVLARAWEEYKRLFLRNGRRRQLRKRDFLAGFEAGVDAERERTRRWVTPANLTLYDLVRRLDEDPELLPMLKEQHPELVKQLVHFVKGSK